MMTSLRHPTIKERARSRAHDILSRIWLCLGVIKLSTLGSVEVFCDGCGHRAAVGAVACGLPPSAMEMEAQRVLSMSLDKIGRCRRRRREMSLHKSLLVTTVIQKARMAMMEEDACYLVNYYYGNGRLPDYYVQQQQFVEHQQQLSGSSGTYMQQDCPSAAQPPVTTTTTNPTTSTDDSQMDWESEGTFNNGSSNAVCGDPDDKENVAPAVRGVKRTRQAVSASGSAAVVDEAKEPACVMAAAEEMAKRLKKNTGSWAAVEDPQTTNNCEDVLRLTRAPAASLGPPDLCSKQAMEGMDLGNTRAVLAMAV